MVMIFNRIGVVDYAHTARIINELKLADAEMIIILILRTVRIIMHV